MKMSSRDILEDILTHYESREEWQSEIAERCRVSKADIGRLLRECGFQHGKFMNGKSVDINSAWQNPKVREICEKIYNAQP